MPHDFLRHDHVPHRTHSNDGHPDKKHHSPPRPDRPASIETFKAGDRVRALAAEPMWTPRPLNIGDEGTVLTQDGGCVEVSFDGQPPLKGTMYWNNIRRLDDQDGSLLHSSEAEGEEDEETTQEVRLPSDAYGATIYALIYDAREILSRSDDAKPVFMNLYRLLYVLMILFVNYVFQFFLLYAITEHVVQPSVHRVQAVYQQFHAKYFSEDGDFLVEHWDADVADIGDLRYKHRLCQMVFSNILFLSVILMLWVMIMVIEARKNLQLLVDLNRLPTSRDSRTSVVSITSKGSGDGNDDEAEAEDKISIVSLTPCVRVLTILLIILPKFLINFGLTVIGMIWLSATESFSDVILNSLSLQFVVGINDHLFESCMPETYMEEIEKVVLSIPRKKLTLDEEVEQDWKSWKRSTFFFIFIPVFVFTYLKCLQFLPFIGILPYFKEDMNQACSSYLSEHTMRLCEDGFSHECFLYGGRHGINATAKYILSNLG